LIIFVCEHDVLCTIKENAFLAFFQSNYVYFSSKGNYSQRKQTYEILQF